MVVFPPTFFSQCYIQYLKTDSLIATKRVGFSSTFKVSDIHVIRECELDKYTFESRLAKVTFCEKGVLAQQLK